MAKSTMVNMVPIAISIAAFLFSVYTRWVTKRETRRVEIRQFLEHSCSIMDFIFHDLEKFVKNPKPEPLDMFTRKQLEKVVNIKQTALRFQKEPWYETFDFMLRALGNIGFCAERFSEAEKEKKEVQDRLFKEFLDAFFEALKAVGEYLNVARDTLRSL